MSDTVVVGLISGTFTLAGIIITKAIDQKNAKQNETKKDIEILGDMVYQILQHLSTNNNTGGMRAALDKYNEYFRHS